MARDFFREEPILVKRQNHPLDPYLDASTDNIIPAKCPVPPTQIAILNIESKNNHAARPGRVFIAQNQ